MFKTFPWVLKRSHKFAPPSVCHQRAIASRLPPPPLSTTLEPIFQVVFLSSSTAHLVVAMPERPRPQDQVTPYKLTLLVLVQQHRLYWAETAGDQDPRSEREDRELMITLLSLVQVNIAAVLPFLVFVIVSRPVLVGPSCFFPDVPPFCTNAKQNCTEFML